MQKSIFEGMGGTYRQEGDYLLPNLTVPETSPIGIWGQRRKRYLQKHRGPLYTALLLSGKLDAHLADIDHQAQEMLFQLVEQMVKQEGAIERPKKKHQMEWVRKMNNTRERIEEIIMEELILA